ncbi:hypothetical protein [Luteolibacter marinus]|uniref:hypothetical protein n=1 Tax=Luteolibacter marinus TaxID=2776705 RepID=UPI001D02C3F3|nr:hypothetical protein [Luteolibacter marinus]
MPKVRIIFLHLVAGFAGWGAVVAVESLDSKSEGDLRSVDGVATRVARDISGDATVAGQRLLKRLRAKTSRGTSDFFTFKSESPDREEMPSSLPERLTQALGEIGINLDGSAASTGHPSDGRGERARKALYLSCLYAILLPEIEWDGGRNFACAFRHGEMEAMEIHDHFAEILPEVARTEVLRLCLYDSLVQLDPVRAGPLLDTLPQQQATGAKYWAARGYRSEFGPAELLSLLGTIPEQNEEVSVKARRSVWEDHTPRFLESYGSDYLSWAAGLPAGMERDLAIAAMLPHFGNNDGAIYHQFRELIGSDDIRNGLESR